MLSLGASGDAVRKSKAQFLGRLSRMGYLRKEIIVGGWMQVEPSSEQTGWLGFTEWPEQFACKVYSLLHFGM